MTPFKIEYQNGLFYVNNIFNDYYLTKNKAKARILKHNIQKESVQNYLNVYPKEFLKRFKKYSFQQLYKFLENL